MVATLWLPWRGSSKGRFDLPFVQPVWAKAFSIQQIHGPTCSWLIGLCKNLLYIFPHLLSKVEKPNCARKKNHCAHTWPFFQNFRNFSRTEFCSLLLFTGSKQANGEGLVEDGDIRFCSDQSFDETDLGDEDGEANEEGKEGSKNIAGHLKRIRNETCFY